MADRIDQHQQGRHIAAEALGIEPTGLNARRTDQQHRQDPGRLEKPHHRVLQGQQPLGPVAGPTMQVDLVVKALLQPGFCRKRPHQRQAADRFAQQAGQFADLLLAALGRPHHPRPEQTHQHRHQRGQHQGGQ